MPTYEFYCKICEKCEEIFLKHIITDEEQKRLCPDCNKMMDMIIFSPNWKIDDKQHGWYIQDRGFNNDKPEYNFYKKQKGLS